MTDRALVNAQKRRDNVAAKINQLAQELEDARKELAAAETFIKDWHRFAGTEAGTVSDTQKDSGYPQADGYSYAIPDSVPPPPPPRPAPKNPDRGTVGRHAWQIITDANRPFPRSELFRALAERGVHIYGKDPEMVLSTMMWRMQSDFVRLPKFGYWRRNKPWPAANYIPGAEVEDDGESSEIALQALLDDVGMLKLND